jgi:hypothetical protein
MVRWTLTPSRIARSVARGGHGRLEAELERLKDTGYRVWNDLRVGAEVLDHVIVGAAGVFALQCSRPKRGTDGGVGDAVWQVTREAVALQRRLREARLGLPVRGIVALTGSVRSRIPVDFGKVSVLAADHLVRFVDSLGERLTPEQRFVAAGVLQRDRRPRWHPSLGS